MTMLTSTLAEYQVRVLDIGQSVIHDELNLGILVQLPESRNAEVMQQTLISRFAGYEAVLRFTAIGRQEYSEWVAKQGLARHIVTLLGHKVDANQLAAIIQTVEDSGLIVDGIRRLTGRISLEKVEETNSRMSIELSVRGGMLHPLAIKKNLLQIADSLDYDCSIQRDSVYRRNRRLVAFDMDSTLIREEVIDELAKLAGVGGQVAAITRRAMLGELDFQESFRQRVALLKGLPESAMDQVARTVVLTEGAERLVKTLKILGYTTAIISGGFQHVAEHLKEVLGIDHVHANTIEIVDGHITGRVCEEIVDAQRKASLLRDICEAEDIHLQQAVAIGDGANDLPMLSVAGLGVAFHAKPLVRDSADHAISNFGLDCVLYLMGFSDQEVDEMVLLAT